MPLSRAKPVSVFVLLFAAVIGDWNLASSAFAVRPEALERPAAAAVAEPVAKPPLVLLVGGMTYDLKRPVGPWGAENAAAADKPATYTGMIGALVRSGYQFGGTVTAAAGKVELPAGILAEADLFVLEFSPAAQVDGLGIKALELAGCLKELRLATGRDSVQIVAHSAGGIVARTYLQSALPGVKYAGDVRSLTTIGTPHFGSELATHLGDWLGTRATSLQPGAPLIQQLNSELELPADVHFASIIVRGLGADVKGEGSAYDSFVDHDFLRTLPVDYCLGGDQVVHVRSQNLAIAPCARRYEAATKRPVHYLAVRVEDPSPQDSWPCQTTVHEVSPHDADVQSAVQAFLSAGREAVAADRREADKAVGVDPVAPIELLYARCQARTLLEETADVIHKCSQVVSSRDLELTEFRREGDRIRATFTGTTISRGPLRVLNYTTKIKGDLTLELDAFGRPRGLHYDAKRVK